MSNKCWPINYKKMDMLMMFNFCRRMKKFGQTILGAGPLSLRMVIAVILAVTVYAKHA